MTSNNLTICCMLLGCCILIIIVLLREIIKYEPNEYKYRFLNAMQQKGWFAQKADFSEIRSDDTCILLTLGQSNAGNYGDTRYQPRFKNQVYNYSNGNLYYAKDPLIGCGGHDGSVWGRVADLLIEHTICKKVVIVPIAVGGSSVEEWAGGYCCQKLIKTLDDLKMHNIHATHILWHQGEADNGKTLKDTYERALSVIVNTIRSKGQTAPFYVSIASFTPTSIYLNGIDVAISDAQKDFIIKNENVYTGPDTDALILAKHRFDAQHFSETGLQEFAKRWLLALQKPEKAV